MEIGSCARIIEDNLRHPTTPIHEIIEYKHYNFALQLISEAEGDFNTYSDGLPPLMWTLQYLDSETEEEQYAESEIKVRLILALIKSGANPNPIVNGEELINYIRFRINEADESEATAYHLWQMEHIVEANSKGDMKKFINKLKEHSISKILLSDWGFSLFDDDLCDCDHLVIVFDDGEKMRLSSCQICDNEWDFYAVSITEEELCLKYHTVSPYEGKIKLVSIYCDEEIPSSHWIDLSIDDAILRLHADQPDVTVGVVSADDIKENDNCRKRKALFEKSLT